ncbi:MAG: hypothetical protein H6742_16115 [Alphaproteobacteria bacterium]|nr:hypothetical protein [Alphaproteobacteria bacterium]
MSYPYRLRMEHEGLWSLRLEREGPWLRFDPRSPPDDGQLVVLTWCWPEHLDATAAALREGRDLTVVAAPEILDWLHRQGAPRDRLLAAPVEREGLRIEQVEYTPIPWVTPDEAVHKLKSAVLRPDRAVARLGRKRGLPRCGPRITAITFPDGQRLLHLALALHQGTPDGWLDDVVARFGGPDLLVLGADHGHQDAVRQRIARFSARRVLVVDLLGEVRRNVGMPTELLTPMVDALRADGLDAYVFASRVSYRFEA